MTPQLSVLAFNDAGLLLRAAAHVCLQTEAVRRHAQEYGCILSLSVMCLYDCCNVYESLHCSGSEQFLKFLPCHLQDAIVVTSSGAETLPFLASFQLPASLAFFVIYGRIIDLHLPRSLTFALVVAPLLAAYAGFALFLYPAADLLHPHGFTAALAPMLPVGLHGLLKVRPLSEVRTFHAPCRCTS